MRNSSPPTDQHWQTQIDDILDRFMDLESETTSKFRLYAPGSPFSPGASKDFRPSEADLAGVRTLGEFLDVHGPSIAKSHAAHQDHETEQKAWLEAVRELADALE